MIKKTELLAIGSNPFPSPTAIKGLFHVKDAATFHHSPLKQLSWPYRRVGSHHNDGGAGAACASENATIKKEVSQVSQRLKCLQHLNFPLSPPIPFANGVPEA